MANLPDYVAMAKPNPLDNRAPWWKNTAQTYAGIMLWFVFWTYIPGAGVSDSNPAGLLACGLGTALAALFLAALLCHTMFYLVPGKLGMKTGLPLYIVGTSTYGVKGGFLMPGFLMGLLQYGWLAVNAWGSGTLFTCMTYGVEAKLAPNYPMFYVVAIAWACAAAFIGLKGIKYVAGVATWFPIIPIVVLIALFVQTKDGIKNFDPAKVTAQAAATAEEVAPAPSEEATPTDAAPEEAAPVASEATADEVAEDAATPAEEVSPIAEAVEKAEGVVAEVTDKAQEVAAETVETVKEAAEEVKGATAEVVENAQEVAAGAAETVKEVAEEVKEEAEEVAATTSEAVVKATTPAEIKPLSKFAVFNLMLAYILGFFATAGAAGCDMGTANRNSTDIQLGGLVGILGSTVFAGGLSLAIYAGAYGQGLCAGPVGQTTDLMNAIMGNTIGKVFMIALAIAAFPSACFCSMVAANSFKTTLPKVNPFITCGLGVLGAIILIVTRYAGDAGAVFGTIGASFGPICGAMAADYILSGCKWNGPRAGFNPAGWISWFFGFVVGAYGFFTSICPCLPQFEMPCPPLLACIVGFVLYFILAAIGCKTRTLPMEETNA